MSPALGNDVVDLTGPRTRGKAQDARFLARVCTPAERARIVAAPPQERDRLLWQVWSAKEAAFKVARKRLGRPAFSPARFETSFASAGEGEVRFRGWAVPVAWQVSADFVHCLGAWPRRPSGILSAVRAVERAEEPSEAVRVLARRLLAARGLSGVTIGREGREPPYLLDLASGRRLPGEVSLSHHGRFVAAAIWLPEGFGRGA